MKSIYSYKKLFEFEIFNNFRFKVHYMQPLKQRQSFISLSFLRYIA